MTYKRKDDILNYIRDNFSVDATVLRLFDTVMSHVFIHGQGSLLMISEMLQEIGMKEYEITSILKGCVPRHKEVFVPVFARLNTSVKTWVRVPEGAGNNEIKQAAIQNIVNSNFDYNDCWEIEEEDISIYNIDNEGTQEADDE